MFFNLKFREEFFSISIIMKEIILIVGYSGSGKSTISKKFGETYHVLELDKIVNNNVKKRFPKLNVYQIYKYEIPDVLKKHKVDEYFVKQVRNIIQKHKKIIVEGTLKNKAIITSIFKNYDYTIMIVKPKNKSIYRERVISRFIADPAHFGTLGFLGTEDSKVDFAGLNDYIKNGIQGKIITKVINRAVNRVYHKHNENELFFKNNFNTNIEIIKV
jgi:hypothetical protein